MAKASSPKSQEVNIELMIFLIDQNLEGYAEILLGAIASKGWLDLLPIQFITFAPLVLGQKYWVELPSGIMSPLVPMP